MFKCVKPWKYRISIKEKLEFVQIKTEKNENGG